MTDDDRTGELLVDFPVTVEIPVAWGDMDAMGHVNNAVYFRYFETARISCFADLGLDELRNLNPRTALQRAILGDEQDGIRGDLRRLDPREELRSIDPRRGLGELMRADGGDEPVSMRKTAERPLARGEQAPYDDDAT